MPHEINVIVPNPMCLRKSADASIGVGTEIETGTGNGVQFTYNGRPKSLSTALQALERELAQQAPGLLPQLRELELQAHGDRAAAVVRKSKALGDRLGGGLGSSNSNIANIR